MTWTYAGAPGLSTSAERRDLVRFLVGDTVSGYTPTATDEEITYALNGGTSASAVQTAAITVGRALLARFARDADFTRSKVSVSASQRYKALAEVVAQLEADAFTLASAGPFLGGSSVSVAETDRENTDLRQPQLTIDDGREAWTSAPSLITSAGG